jgi:hypothetical protein
VDSQRERGTASSGVGVEVISALATRSPRTGSTSTWWPAIRSRDSDEVIVDPWVVRICSVAVSAGDGTGCPAAAAVAAASSRIDRENATPPGTATSSPTEARISAVAAPTEAMKTHFVRMAPTMSVGTVS